MKLVLFSKGFVFIIYTKTKTYPFCKVYKLKYILPMNKYLLVFFLFFVSSISCLAHEFLAEGFAVQQVTNEFQQVVSVEFDHLGKMYICRRDGYVSIYEEGKETVTPIDISNEVDNLGDQGLMNIALHPNFEENGYIYLLYLADFHFVTAYGTPDYDPNFDYFGPSVHRVTRYTLDANTNFTSLVPNSRKVILGETVADGIPQLASVHGSGALEFGTDGSLFVSAGDGSTYEGYYTGDGPPYYNEFVWQALETGVIDHRQEKGSFRSQIVNNLNGKILRINPETGEGYPTNPFYNAENPREAKSRVWSLGLRNPFRFSVKPGSGSTNVNDGNPGILMVGDVGEGAWEELNVVRKGGQNFGWPLFEGVETMSIFAGIPTENEDYQNPLYPENCDNQYFNFQDLIIQNSPTEVEFYNPCDETQLIPENIYTFQHSLPDIIWPHAPDFGYSAYIPAFNENGEPYAQALENQNTIDNDGSFTGYASIGGDFYEGETWPEQYHQGYFHADYVMGFIRFFGYNDLNELKETYRFYDDDLELVDVQYNPHDECLYFVNFTWEGSEIYKICYGVNPPPIAEITVDSYFGVSPLTVNFSAENSYDSLDEEIIDYSWNFGDGNTANGIEVEHTFIASSNNPTSFLVQLSVTDLEGNIGVSEQIISLNNTPPQINISSISEGYTFSLAGKNVVALEAEVFDNEHSNDELTYTWQTILYHDDHNHPEPIVEAQNTETILDPVGCDGAVYYYKIVHTVTDPTGLSASEAIDIFPDCETEPFVDFGLFVAKTQRENILLSWFTLEEKDVQNFEIQRKIGGENWEIIDNIQANSPAFNQEYQTTDIPPSDTYVSYRVKIISNNGVEVYSNPVQAILQQRSKLYLYPNPTTGTLNLDIYNLDLAAVLNIYNTNGKLVYTKYYEGTNAEGWFIDRIDLPNLIPGIYVVQIKNGNEELAEKLIVK